MRTYAANKLGNGFGDITSFTTAGGKPVVSEFKVVNNGILSVALSVKINANGFPTQVMFDFGTNQGSLANSVSAVPNSSTGEETIFYADLKNLNAGSVYYFKVRAGNSVGTTESPIISLNPYAAKDVDGNYYHAVKIGAQIWPMENLKVEHYSDGSPIANVTSNSAWAGLTTGAYCYFNNDTSMKSTYGALYNWYAATDSRKIAPQGWHAPTFEEWKTFQNYLTSGQVNNQAFAGGYIKESGTSHWNSPNAYATNSSRFTALGAGGRTDAGLFEGDSFKEEALFWSSSAFGPGADATYVVRDNGLLQIAGIFPFNCGMSIRCLKD